MKIKNSVITAGKGILLAAVLTTATFAEEQYTKVDRIKDMHTMSSAMEKIQKGILYRDVNNNMIASGIQDIRKVMHTIEKIDPKDFLDKEEVYAYKFAKKTEKMLDMYLDEMEIELKRGNHDEVTHNYTLVLRQCTSCHLRLRK